jgi:hypothetical protein
LGAEPRPGSEWRTAARTLERCHISSIIFPSPDLTFVALYHGGVMMSRDRGKSNNTVNAFCRFLLVGLLVSRRVTETFDAFQRNTGCP